MMDLQTLRINRTPVSQNSKCEGCVHYDGNAAAKGGACEVGQAPALCGNGAEPKYGYAALAELSPDEIDDLATPSIHGTVGAMNEHGDIEKMITMQRVCLGDDDLTIAQRIHGTMMSALQKSIAYAQGQVNASSSAELGIYQVGSDRNIMVTVAKSLHDLHLSPRKQRKYGVADVLDFLASKGMSVTDEDRTVCKSRFGPTREIKVPTHAEAMAHIERHMKEQQSLDKPRPLHVPFTSPAAHTPTAKPGNTPRSRSITQPIPKMPTVVKADNPRGEMSTFKPTLVQRMKTKLARPSSKIDEFGNPTKPNAVIPQATLLKKASTSIPPEHTQSIGITRSTKPIMRSALGHMSTQGPSVPSGDHSRGGWTPDDHMDAYRAHMHAARDAEHGYQGTRTGYDGHSYQPEAKHNAKIGGISNVQNHKDAAEFHARAAGFGSHGMDVKKQFNSEIEQSDKVMSGLKRPAPRYR